MSFVATTVQTAGQFSIAIALQLLRRNNEYKINYNFSLFVSPLSLTMQST